MAKPKFQISCEAKDNKAVIRIDGYISDWNNHAVGFKAKLDELINQGVTDAEIYINTPGGDCFQANEIGNEIARFPGKIRASLGALCASAGTYIACRCNFVQSVRNISYMIHKPMGGFWGNSDEAKGILKLLENLEKEYLGTYAKKTGLTTDALREMWKNDYWMDADEALSKGFIDKIEGEADITEEDVLAIASYRGAPKIAASAKHKPIENKITDNMRELLIVAMAMDAKSTDSQILAKFEEYKILALKAETYKQQVEELKTRALADNIKAVLTKAKADKKITASQEGFYEKRLIENFDETKAHIETLPSATKLSEVPKSPSSAGEDRSRWTYADYQDKDYKALSAMAENEPESFQRLAEAHYGRKF